ncbi:MAG: FtsK/SpoIIIE domain-containing protein [Clostridium sp.]
MLIEGILVAGAVTKIGLIFTEDWRKKRKEIKNIKYRWQYLMQELNISSKDSNYTFHITEVVPITNGYTLMIHVPTGLNYSLLETNKQAIENAFRGIIIIEQIRFSSLAKITLINKDIGKYEFKPVKAHPNQLYVGKTFDNKPYFIDICKASHILIGGATGTGKTFLLSSILTNLIYNSSKSIELHLSQIMKGEISLFKDCKCVKFCGMTLREVCLDLMKIAELVDKRSKIFTASGTKNLQHFNKHFPKKWMKRIYFVIEEISFFMPGDADDDITKELKAKCFEAILTIVKAGRSSGVHLLSVTQRSTVTNLPSDVKSQMCRITFKQISSIDSRNIIECDDAVLLKDRECLAYGTSDIMQPIKTPWIDEDFKILNEYVSEIKIPQVNSKKNDTLNKPILVNDGVAKELPLYVKPIIVPNEPVIEVVKPIKKEKKGRVRDYDS